jgi:hypothetical protein
MEEIWKDVVGYEGRYLISNTGRLKSIIKNGVEKLLKGSLSKQGYWQYSLNWKEKNKYNVYTAQQLVAISFLNHFPDSTKGYVIDHINDNRLDNRLENLRLVTAQENAFNRSRLNAKGYTWNKCANETFLFLSKCTMNFKQASFK